MFPQDTQVPLPRMAQLDLGARRLTLAFDTPIFEYIAVFGKATLAQT
jgi:hypothetical protein